MTKNKTYRKPKQSKATRTISAKSNASGRSRILGRNAITGETQVSGNESLLEDAAHSQLWARDDVLDIWEQPPRFPYIDPDGRRRWCYPDNLIWMASGLKICGQIKPAELVERTNFRAEMECMRRDMPVTYADEMILITDRSFAAYEARNARLLLQFKGIEETDADADIARRLSALVGTASIAELIDGASDRGAAYRATFRAIYSGKAEQVVKGDITPNSIIKRVEEV